MKKFIALLMALVMALSLTTVAWGATPTPVSDATELKTALLAGESVKLTADITLTESLMVTYAGTIVIDGDGHKITTNGFEFALGDVYSWAPHDDSRLATHNYTVKNVNFDGTSSGRVIASDVVALFDNCTFKNFTGESALYGGYYAKLTVDGCKFESNSATSIYLIFTDSNVVIKNSEFSNNNSSMVIYVAHGSVAPEITNNVFENNTVTTSGNGAVIYTDNVIVTDNTFTGNTIAAAGERAGVVVVDGGEVNANIFSDNDPDTSATGTTYVATVVSKGDVGTTSLDVSGNYWDGGAPDYANAKGNTVTATTYYTTAVGGVLSGLTSAVPATNNIAKYTLWGAKVAATATGVNYIATDMALPDATKAVAPVAPALNGSVAYYTVLGTKYVQGTADDCDVYFTIKGKTVPVLYLKEIGSQNYIAAATEFTNFGKACGQVKVTPVAGTKYYTYTDANDVVYIYAQDVSTGAMANASDFLLVGGKMVPVVTASNLYDNLVPHSWAFSKNAKGVVDSAKCVDCGATAKVYSTYTAVPVGADYIREGVYFLVINAPVVTDKTVTSAETFDAGIAMYVGMSIMAAAGGAVVIGKKKD